MDPIHDASPEPHAATAVRHRPGDFVAINSITCDEPYRQRFEELFRSRAHAIDRAPGFRHMYVLQPETGGAPYLVVSFWDGRASFDAWRASPEFAEGHRRGFADVRGARERGEKPPMTSSMETYRILCD
jgi:heme-degrading monooxygenase HmoA